MTSVEDEMDVSDARSEKKTMERVPASSPYQEEISPNIVTRSRSTLLLNRVQKEYV